jgi:hypothetical protein
MDMKISNHQEVMAMRLLHRLTQLGYQYGMKDEEGKWLVRPSQDNKMEIMEALGSCEIEYLTIYDGDRRKVGSIMLMMDAEGVYSPIADYGPDTEEMEGILDPFMPG